MYRFAYAEVLNDDVVQHRAAERMALDRAIALLERARHDGVGSIAAVEALDFTRQLWTIFVTDTASEGNDLPADLRANLVSIGIWVLREVENLRKQKTQSFNDLIEVCQQISEGLS